MALRVFYRRGWARRGYKALRGAGGFGKAGAAVSDSGVIPDGRVIDLAADPQMAWENSFAGLAADGIRGDG